MDTETELKSTNVLLKKLAATPHPACHRDVPPNGHLAAQNDRRTDRHLRRSTNIIASIESSDGKRHHTAGG